MSVVRTPRTVDFGDAWRRRNQCHRGNGEQCEGNAHHDGAPNCVSCDIDRRSARFIPNQTHSRVGATSVALRPKCVEFSEESSRTADGNKFCRSAISSEEATPASTKAYATPKLKGDSHEGHHQLARGRGTAVRHQHRCCPSASHKSPDGLRGRDASRRLDALTVRPVSRMRGRLRPRIRAAWFSLAAGSPSPCTGSCLPTCTFQICRSFRRKHQRPRALPCGSVPERWII